MVESLCAITILVHFRLSSDSETVFCVRLSRAEVASSNISTFGFGAMARAIISRCRCPPEIPPLPSEIIVCIPIGIRRISSAMPDNSAACQASSIVSHGADMIIFEKISPVKSLPFCITTPILRLKDFKSTAAISLPST